MTDKNNFVLIEFIGLRAKMFAGRMDDTKNTKKLKSEKNKHER